MAEALRSREPFPWLCCQCGAESVFPEKIAYDTTLRYEGRDYRIAVPELSVLKCRHCGETLLNNDSDAELSRAFQDALERMQTEAVREGLIARRPIS